MPELLHVTLVSNPEATEEEIKAKMDLAIDWFKYADNCWLLWTVRDIAAWKERLSPLFRPNGKVLICKINASECDGFIAKDCWKWLRAHGRDTSANSD